MKIDKNEIIDQFNIFFFAGMDTTGHLSAVTLYQLALNPKFQDLALEEINKNISFDKKSDGEIYVKHEDLKNL